MSDQNAICLGVAGGTGSGKTTVARAILEAVGADQIAYLAQDSYYRDVNWGVEAELAGYNFDHPDAFDADLFLRHLEELRAGRPVEVPVYDFVTHRRSEETRPLASRPVVLVEGILLYAVPEVRELLDFKVYVDTESDLRLIRRIRRDIENRGRSLESVLDQYLTTVRPMHLEFTEPSKRWADVIVPEGGRNRVAVDMVIARVREVIREKR